MGVINLQLFNVTLMIKWHWRWIKLERALTDVMFGQIGKDDRMVPDALVFCRSDKVTQAFWSISMLRIVGMGKR